MAAIYWSDVSAAAPELGGSAVNIVEQTQLLKVVNGVALDVNNFGGEPADTLKTARALLAAHIATMLKRRGIAGPIASEKIDGVSRSYAIMPWLTRWDMTSYGVLFSTMVRTTPARAGFLANGGSRQGSGWGW